MSEQHERESWCLFCALAAEQDPAGWVNDWPQWGVFAIASPDPIADGHVLVVPYEHTADVGSDPMLAGRVMVCAGIVAGGHDQADVVTSRDVAAGDGHMLVEVVPRRADDGLVLFAQEARAGVPVPREPGVRVA